ncbi:hypothetical protein DESC_500027 [Desulfosarcina cetonica]|nr:hypothetical protein DESC_500027 [Desulfosarcina cetonica]
MRAPHQQQNRGRLAALEGPLPPEAETGQGLQAPRTLGLGFDHAAQGIQFRLDAELGGDPIAVVHAIGGVEQDLHAEALRLDGHPLGDPRRFRRQREVISAARAGRASRAQGDGAGARQAFGVEFEHEHQWRQGEGVFDEHAFHGVEHKNL